MNKFIFIFFFLILGCESNNQIEGVLGSNNSPSTGPGLATGSLDWIGGAIKFKTSFTSGITMVGSTLDAGLGGSSAVAVDLTNGYFYVGSNSRIQKFKLDTAAFVGSIGNLTSSYGTCPASGAASGWCTGGTFATGAGDGMFNSIKGIAIDGTADAMYVADYGNHRIQKFTLSTGAFVGSIGLTSASSGTCPAAGTATGWCTGGTFTFGTSDAQFKSPAGIAVDSVNGFIFVSDIQDRVQKFNASTGAFIGAAGYATSSTGTCVSSATNGWCTGGSFTSSYTEGYFNSPTGIFADVAGNTLYVAHRGRISKAVLSTGVITASIGYTTSSTGTCPASGATTGWCTGGTFTTGTGGDGKFLSTPMPITADLTHDRLYVGQDNRIQSFVLSTGALVGSIGVTSASTGTCPASGAATTWCTGGTFAYSIAEGGFNSLVALAVDPNLGTLYTADSQSGRLDSISSSGAFIGSLGAYASLVSGWGTRTADQYHLASTSIPYSTQTDGKFNSPRAVELDTTNGSIYVADGTSIRKHDLNTGAFIGAIGYSSASTGTCPAGSNTSGWCTGGTFAGTVNPGSISSGQGFAIDPVHDFLYVGDSNYRIQKFVLSTGVYVGSIGKTSSSTGTCPASGVASGWCTGGVFTSSTVDGGFNAVTGIVIDATNDFLYAVDSTGRVQKFTLSTGAFVGAVGKLTASTGTCPASGVAPGWCTGGTFTVLNGDGGFNNADALSIDTTNGFLYVADAGNKRIVKLNLATGAFVGAIGNLSASAGTCPASGASTGWCTGGTFAPGSSDGMFTWPEGVFADPANNALYVSEIFSYRIEKFDLTTGAFIGSVGYASASTGTCVAGSENFTWCTGGTFIQELSSGAFGSAEGLKVDSSTGYFYVPDSFSNVLFRFK